MSIVVHRDIPGVHDELSKECWCNPVVVEDDDFRIITVGYIVVVSVAEWAYNAATAPDWTWLRYTF